MLYYFKSFRALKTIRLAMLAIIIFAATFNCFRVIVNGEFENKRFKYVGTQYGKIRGHSANDGDYLAFLGIPYAAPPVGDNRFKSPKPPLPWGGIYDAIRTTKCPQMGEGEEDCLLLNIFTPLVIPGTPLAVLVYIHGGSFIMGAAPTSGVEHLIKKNIIVVTINYRLGALGFLCLGIPEAQGNAGLKDQVAALKFVQENIGHFGGDPQRVTVYGMSAGGASVEYLILSRKSRSLFHQAIIESGSAISPWALDRNPVVTAKKVAELLDIPSTDYGKILVEHYKQIPSDVLAEANFDYYNNLTDGTFGFAPCVENTTKGGQEPFLTKPPDEILKTGDFRRMPTMFFFTTLEGLYLRSAEYHKQHYKKRMETNFRDFLPADLNFHSDEVRNETAMRIKRFYFSKGIGKIPYLNYFGDSLIMHGLLNSVEYHARSYYNPVYLMEFGYKGNLGGSEEFYERVNVAGHGDVVKYAILNDQPETESDKLTVRRVTKLIANFVKYGNPTPAKTALLPIQWPPVYYKNMTCFYLGQDFDVYSKPYWDRKTFWDNVYGKSQKRGSH